MPQKSQHQVHVAVATAFLPDQSQPDEKRYAFAYTITITNLGTVPARLLQRHWIITDANAKVQEVQGDGVVGKQPHLVPGQSFRYTSGAILETPVGCMQGSYLMQADDGTRFKAPIAAFNLSMPNVVN
jgi:ApaG protein